MDVIDSVFGPQGALAQAFPGYQPRDGQVAFARRVAQVISSGGLLMAECPTGTGKSVGYLAPAIMTAGASGRKIVVATANIALQEQLVGKDLPMLRKILPVPFTFALLKGISNFLCVDRLKSKTHQDEASSSDGMRAEGLRRWASQTTSGDVSELSYDPGPLWRHFAVGAGECKGSDCRYKDNCWGRKARERARSCEVIVCNYHVLLTHLALKAKTGKDLILPELDVVILDEAHKLPDLAREFFGEQLSAGALRRYGAYLTSAEAHSLRARMSSEADMFFDALGEFRASKGYRARLRKPDPVEWRRLYDVMAEAVSAMTTAATKINSGDDVGERDADFAKELVKSAIRLAAQRDFLAEAMTLADPDNCVYHVELEGRDKRAVLKKTVVDPGPALEQNLMSQAKTVVATSATLTVDGKFDHFAAEAGMREADRLIAASPFNFKTQQLMVFPADAPDPKGDREVYAAGICKAVGEAVAAARGRTLCLFTSYRMMDLAHKHLLSLGLPYRILRQGDAPRMQLVADFKEDVHSVLLGVESFWAGVDVPGEALSCVVIDKLPFITPEDPVCDLISERNPNWFFDYAVPRAIVQMKQGAGRLIRSVSDRGALVLLDRRLLEKAYGAAFIRSLPRSARSRNLADVATFLG